MKIILHANKNCDLRNQLKSQIESQFPDGQILLTNSEQHLSESLCRPLHNVSMLIAFISDSDSISLLFPLKPLFENIKLILMFHRNFDGIEESAILMEPLYTSYTENNFKDVILILQRIAQKKLGSVNGLGIR